MTPALQPDILPVSDREYLEGRRRALLMELGVIEKRLNLPRTVPPKAERPRDFYASSEERSPRR